jgi:FAD/FMN-containing dehydrogenase
MHLFSILAALLLHCWLGVAGSVSCPLERRAGNAGAYSTAKALKALLSADSKVAISGDPGWSNLLSRASYPRIDPEYNVIVSVATESDVQNVIGYCHENEVPFLTVSGAHGWSKSLNKLKNGIQINLRNLNNTEVDEGGETATIGGGALQYETTKALYGAGKQAVTGLCECISVAGPLLGGGHGYLQSQYGYALDNLVSAEVVLANGSSVEASEEKNSDLFWALRGAGHNFGVVTNFKVKVYDIPDDWTVYTFFYKGEKLEELFKLVNEIDSAEDRPEKLMLAGSFLRYPEVDPDNVSLHRPHHFAKYETNSI